MHKYDVVWYPWNATLDTPTITGLVSDVILLTRMEEIQDTIR